MPADTAAALSARLDWIDQIDALLQLAEITVGDADAIDLPLAVRIAFCVEIGDVRKRLRLARASMTKAL